jgi:ABC-type maltose transport system permease subunit
MTTASKPATRAAVRYSESGPVIIGRWRWQLLRLVIAIIGVIYALFPAYLILIAALSPNADLNSQTLIPRTISLVNIDKVLSVDPNDTSKTPILLWAWNSVKVSATTAIISTMLCALAAYSFSRFRFRGRRGGLLAILLIQLFPNLLMVGALYLLLKQLNLLDSHLGLILIYSGGALGVNTWLMKGYFDTIPRELDESAMVDGAGQLTTFLQIIFPLIRPILVVIALLSFIGTYSDYLIASIMIKDRAQYTLAVGMFTFINGKYSTDWGPFAAAALVGALPIVLLFLFLQGQLSSGLTAGAVKG